MHREQVVVQTERKIIKHNLENHKVDLVWGEASLQGANTVHVKHHDGSTVDLTADVILIATGSSPFRPAGIPFDGKRVHDSDTILHMGFIPTTMTVVGGGVIGCEYASIFAALGVKVTLIDSRGRLLPFVDPELIDRLTTQLKSLGLRFVYNTKVQKVETSEDHVTLALDNGEAISCDSILFASGRQSNTAGLGLEALGVNLGDRGLILVNDKYQTNIPNIYAAGDVIGFPALASTSMEQARVAMVHAFGLKYKEAVSPVLPLAVYTIPEMSMVGLNEDECKQKNIQYLTGRAYYENNPRGQIIGDMCGMLKLIFSPADKKLLGVHLIGEMASELIHIGAHVLAEGETIDSFIHAVYNYPTLSDLYKYAAYDGLGYWERWVGAAKMTT
jgi:NAD(P) transhydrogenase